METLLYIELKTLFMFIILMGNLWWQTSSSLPCICQKSMKSTEKRQTCGEISTPDGGGATSLCTFSATIKSNWLKRSSALIEIRIQIRKKYNLIVMFLTWDCIPFKTAWSSWTTTPSTSFFEGTGSQTINSCYPLVTVPWEGSLWFRKKTANSTSTQW